MEDSAQTEHPPVLEKTCVCPLLRADFQKERQMEFRSEYYLTDEQLVERYHLSEEDRVYVLPYLRKTEDDYFMYVVGLM